MKGFMSDWHAVATAMIRIWIGVAARVRVMARVRVWTRVRIKFRGWVRVKGED